jgi:hypothetical protein
MRPYTTEEQAIDVFNWLMSGYFWQLPVIVEAFVLDPPRVTVKPAIMSRYFNGNEIIWKEHISIPDCPILLSRAGNFTMTLPIKQGDRGILLILDSNITEFLKTGKLSKTGNEIIQDSPRKHNLADGVYIPGWLLKVDNFKDYSLDSLVLRTNDNKTKIEIRDKDINVTGDQNVTINAGNNVIVNAGSNATIKAGANVTLQAPNVSISGTFTITSGSTGTINSSSSLTVNAPQVILGSKTQIDGRDFLSHTHKYVRAMSAEALVTATVDTVGVT